jgi:YidC/Oxa1 family membrane protein insertase
MADTPSSKPPIKPAAGKEMPMEVRLLLTLSLMGLVLFLTPYFLKTTAPAPAKKEAPAAKTEQPEPAKQEPPAAKPVPAVEPAPPSAQVAGDKLDDHILIETGFYRVVFSNRGAVVRRWILKRYRDNEKKPVELTNQAGIELLGAPFSIQAKEKLSTDPNTALYAVKRSSDGLGIDFEFFDGKTQARKSFRFEPDRYLVKMVSELREQERPVPHLVSWRGGFGDFTVVNTLSTQQTMYFDAATGKLIVNDVSAAKDGPVSVTGRFLFTGIQDQYFTAVALPERGASIEVQTWSDKVAFGDSGKEEPHIGLALGGQGVNETFLFVGPKDIDLLRRVDPRLEQVVDFGWFWFLAKPLFVSLNFVNDRYIHNYGWTIVIVTILINFLMLPLKFTSLKSMKKMSDLQPQIKAIQARYQNIGMRDPRKQQQTQEMMELYQKNGVNPMGGCIPMLLQIPFFFAFYKVLTVAIEMRGAQWLWVTDLSQPENLAIRILPLATIATQFVMQKMTPSTTADPQQQRIMTYMPLMFIFIFYSVASGLVLYWLTGNVVGIAQQWFFNRSMKLVPAKTMPVETPKKKSGKK